MESQLIKYVRNELGKGFSEDSIKRVLLQDGYNEKQVNHAFMIIGIKRMTAIAIAIVILMSIVFACILLYKNNVSFASKEDNNATQQNANLDSSSYSRQEAASAESAISSNDLNACNNAGNLQGYCKAIVSNDASMCENSFFDLKEACIVRIARNKKDSGLCAGLSLLKENCYLQLALLTDNKALCDNAGNNKEYCVSQLG